MTERGRQRIAALILTAGVFLAAPRAPGRDGHNGASTRPVTSRRGSDVEDKAVTSSGAHEMWVSVLRTVLALAVVVALIFGLRFVLRRFGGGRGARGASAPMSVLARTSVSARQQLLLVRLGRRLILAGSGPEGMTLLTEIHDADEVAHLIRLAEGGDEEVVVETPAGRQEPEDGREAGP